MVTPTVDSITGMAATGTLLFHELPREEQERLWEAAAGYFAEETAVFATQKTYPNLDALDVAAADKEIVPVIANRHFGLVKPLRDNYNLSHLSDDQATIPYLRPPALERLNEVAALCISDAADSGFLDSLSQEGFSSFRLAVTSLARSTHYQRLIVSMGRFARGRNGENDTSVHEMGLAFDIDHAAFYATDQETGAEAAINPKLHDYELSVYGRLLPGFRAVLQSVIETQITNGGVMALHEIPEGWGVWHVAAIPA